MMTGRKRAKNKNRSCVLTRLIGGLLVVSATHSAPAAGPPDWKAVDDYIQSEMKRDRIPGVALAITQGKTIVHSRGFGTAAPDGAAVTLQTGFMLGSMSKAFTALAVMQLVEGGKLELDAPVLRYLPWFAMADPQAAQITVRHLLNHSSGIPTRAPRAAGSDLSLESHARALAGVSLGHLPGAAHEYASPNYQVLGLVVEAVSGQGFAAYLQEKIFAPLEMRHSYVTREAARESRAMSSGHRLWFGLPVAAALPEEPDRLPTATLISSAEDIAHFLIANLNNGQFGANQVLSPAGMAELHRPAIAGERIHYAMGWRVGQIKGAKAVHHGGILPHFRGKMILLAESGYGVVVLTNVSSVLGSPSSHRMADNLAGMLTGQPASQSRLSLGILYLLLWCGLAFISYRQIRGLIQLPRWRQTIAELPTERSSRLRKLGLSTAWELAVPLFLLVALPRLFGFSLTELVRQMPDAGLWMIATALVGLLVGCYKATIAWRVATGRRAGHAPA